MTLDIDDVLQGVVAKQVTVRACLRGDLLTRHEDLEAQLQAARRLDEELNRNAEAPAIAEQIQQLEDEIDAARVPFTFRAIGDLAWSDLLSKPENQPTKEDRENRYQFNPRKFPQAAIAASCVEPKNLTAEKAEALRGQINFGQWSEIWGACLKANVESTEVPFSAAASVVLRGSEKKSERPGTTESPALSS